MTDDQQTSLRNLFGFEPWLFVSIVVGAWILVAAVAYLVAPRDRPGHFFWCTLLLLGPFGIVLALVAPARPEES